MTLFYPPMALGCSSPVELRDNDLWYTSVGDESKWWRLLALSDDTFLLENAEDVMLTFETDDASGDIVGIIGNYRAGRTNYRARQN